MIKVSSKSQLPKELAEKELILIDTNGNEKEARRILDSLKGKKARLAIYGHSDLFNRRVVETMKITFLINPEKLLLDKKDTLKQRDSGMNHVVAKEMAKNRVVLLIDLDYLENLKPKDKAITISRIIQDIKICRKAKCEIKFLQTENKKGLEAIGFSLGMSSQQVKEAFI